MAKYLAQAVRDVDQNITDYIIKYPDNTSF